MENVIFVLNVSIAAETLLESVPQLVVITANSILLGDSLDTLDEIAIASLVASLVSTINSIWSLGILQVLVQVVAL